MIQDTIRSQGNSFNSNIASLFFEQKRQEILRNTETELDLFEFSLFLASSGKKNLDRALSNQMKVREMHKQGKIDLNKFKEFERDF